MKRWGGKRTGAGRPKKDDTAVRIQPYVKKSTKAELNKRAFSSGKSIGEVIDTLIDPAPKKIVDTPLKKK